MSPRLLACLLVVAGCAPAAEPLDAYGGALHLPVAAPNGFFQVASARGRSWLVTPDGHAFVSLGINTFGPDGDADRASGDKPYADTVTHDYRDPAAWASASLARLRDWGFNTVGAWSRYDLVGAQMPRTPILDLAGADWQSGQVPDYFEDAWQARVEQRAQTLIGGSIDDPSLVGWFLDNELRWGSDWRGAEDLFDLYLALPATAAGKRALVAFLQARYGTLEALDAAFATTVASWDALATVTTLDKKDGEAASAREAWSGAVAERYFAVTTAAVRRVDPHHLVLGCRFVSWLVPRAVVAAAGRWVDVVSVNHYELADGAVDIVHSLGDFTRTDDWLSEFASLSGRPLLISEFGFRADDAGLPNGKPPSFLEPVFDDQAQRGDAAARYGHALATTPWLVGVHWFQWVDEPAGGRFDGENSNWGLVDAQDRPYQPVVDDLHDAGPQLAYRTALARP